MKILQNFHDEYKSHNLIEVRDSENQIKFLLNKKDLLNLVKEQATESVFSDLANITKDKTFPLKTKKWFKYNWQDSLEYYLWSRRVDFFDSHVNEKKRFNAQNGLLMEYIQEVNGNIPLPKKISDSDSCIKLPTEKLTSIKSLGRSLHERSCSSHIEKSTVVLEELSFILYNGLIDIKKHRYPKKKTKIKDLLKSFGRSFEFFIVSYDGKLLTPGIYFYDPVSHCMENIRLGLFKNEMSEILIGHSAPHYASCSIVLVQNYEISQWQYRHERALRNLFYESGRIMQRLLIAASSINKQTHITPAANDSKALSLLKLDRIKNQVFYTLTLS